MARLFIVQVFAYLISNCQQELRVTTIQAEPDRVEQTVSSTTSGTVFAEEQANLHFGTSGRVAVVEIKVGDIVDKDQILASLDNDNLKQMCLNSINEFNRDKKLFAKGVISEKQFNDSKLALEEAKCALEKTIIRAPFDGLVVSANLQVGELSSNLSNPQNLPTIVLIDLTPRIVKAPFDELDMPKIKVGQTARITIPAYADRPITGTVKRVVPFISTLRDQDRTTEVEFSVVGEHKDLIPVGASADIEIIIDQKDADLVLPSHVILGTKKSRYVYVLGENGEVAKVSIALGVGNFEKSEISRGLSIEQRVIVPSESSELKLGMKVKQREIH